MEDERRRCINDFPVMYFSKSFFQPNMKKKKVLGLGWKVPQSFTDKEHLMAMNENDEYFTKNTNTSNEFQEAAEGSLKVHDIN